MTAPPKIAFLSVAPPTPNGNLHLGHLSGPYVACDVYRRFLSLQGTAVALVSGSDDNQSYVPVKGGRIGLSPEDVATQYGDAVQATLQRVGVRFDYFLRPIRNPEYIAFVQNFFQRLVASGHVVAREVDGLYCDACRRHLFEAYAGGNCPHCGAETNAQGCEDCGFYNDAIDLAKPECNQCLRTPSRRRIRKFYFAIERQRPGLARFLSQAKMAPPLRAFTDKLLAKPLPEVSASFLSDWGIPVPIAGFEGQVIYEWLEMAAGYLFMAGKLESGLGANPFHGPGDVEIAQFFGFDNGFFYTTFIPALLLADDPGTRLPQVLLSNQYLQLEGSKFSTSTSHAIWGDELLGVVPSDIVRFCLMAVRPEREHTNFTVAACRDLVRSELVEHWEAWLRSLSDRARGEALLSDGPDPFREQLTALTEAITTHYSSAQFSLNEVTRALCRLVRLAHEFSADSSALGLELMAAKTLAVLASPILPDFSLSLWRALGETSQPRWEAKLTLPTGSVRSSLIGNEFSSAAAALDQFEESYRARRNPN